LPGHHRRHQPGLESCHWTLNLDVESKAIGPSEFKNSSVRQTIDGAMVEGEPMQTSLSSKTTYTPYDDRGTTTTVVVPKQPKPSTNET
ncbi:hypothetical protein A2U01_0073485, partial [Trifolium medium]|nr:hypothetical protein [Trifolium medium]